MQIDGRTTTATTTTTTISTNEQKRENVNEQKSEAFRYGGAHSEALLKTEK